MRSWPKAEMWESDEVAPGVHTGKTDPRNTDIQGWAEEGSSWGIRSGGFRLQRNYFRKEGL